MKISTDFRIALVGCGSFSNYVHGPAHKKHATDHPHVTLSACCDLDLNRAKRYAREYGFEHAYNDVETMLETEKPSAVFLIVPPKLTASVALPILERNIPLFLEKPPGLTLSELAPLIEAAESRDTITQVAFNRRYMPLIRMGKKILSDKFTSLFQVDYQMTRFNRTEPDFSTTAVHAIDAAFHLARSPCRKASLSFQEMTQFGKGCVNVAIQAECESGTQVRLNFQPLTGKTGESATIHGLGQSLVIDLFGANDGGHGRFSYFEGDKLKESGEDANFEYIDRNGIYPEIAAFCRSVQAGTKATPALGDCLQQVAFMEAIRTRKAEVRFADTTPLEDAAHPRKEIMHTLNTDQFQGIGSP